MKSLSAQNAILEITVNYSYYDNGQAPADRHISVTASKQSGDVTESINRQYALNGTCTPPASITGTFTEAFNTAVRADVINLAKAI